MNKLILQLGLAQGALYDAMNVDVTGLTLGQAFTVASRVHRAVKNVGDTLDILEKFSNVNWATAEYPRTGEK